MRFLATATALTLLTGTPTLAQIQPTTLNGTLDSNSQVFTDYNGYYNIHTFEGQAGEQITLELTSSEFDSYLILRDSDNKQIAEDDNSGGGRNAKIIVTLPTTGTYTILVNTYAGQTGNYTLSWRASTAEEVELAAAEELELAAAEQLNQQVMQLIGQEQYTEALPLAERALAIREKALGAEHPDVATSLNNLAALYHAQGNIPLATEFLTRGTEVEERNLSHLFTTGSEKQKQAYANTFRNTTDATLSLHLQDAPNDPQAARLALTTLLRRKGRILDALTENLQLLRQNLTPENQTFLDDLLETRSHWATLVYRLPEEIRDPASHRQLITNLTAEAERLEAELARRSAEFRTETEPVTIEVIQQQIPADAALVELVQYRPRDAKAKPGERFGSPRYAAYILHATGEPQWVDLGDAAAIDTAVEAFRKALESGNNPGDLFDKQQARPLYSLLIQPLRQKLGNARHLLFSPDSQLNLIPFAALVDDNDQYLLETYTITYLTTGRDLRRLQLTAPSQQPPILFANPNYELPGDPNSVQLLANLGNLAQLPPPSRTTTSSGNRGSLNITLTFNSLLNTEDEAAAIAPLFPNSTIISQSQATENVLKRLDSPNILHIATHGFFLEIETPEPSDDSNLLRPRPEHQENPLLRSGLALAGFNLRQSGNEDGVLTAMEVAGLRLRGTQLVVLSACKTGVGD
jgi:CHAT domain-containing protein